MITNSKELAQNLSKMGFIMVPVRPNDYVYVIHRRKPVKAKVIYIGLNEVGTFFFNVIRGKIPDSFQTYQFQDTDIGKMVFLTEYDAIHRFEEK